MISTQLTYESPLANEDALGIAPPAGTRCGDFLLAFGHAAEEAIPWRYDFASWQNASSGEDWRLLLQRVNETWKGYPVLAGTVGEWNLLLLGELNDAASHRQERLEFLHDIVTGRASAERLNGHFLITAYDQVRREWHVFTDRFGTLHAYYAFDGRRAALGTFSPSVAAAASRKQLNWPGISAFFSQGFFPKDQTFFSDVRILRPAAHFVFDCIGRMLEEKRYWHWWHQPDQKRSYDETVEQFAQIFEGVMSRATCEGRVGLPISGGLDSRSTVAALSTNHANKNIWAYSYGYSDDSVETRIAARISRASNVPFQAFTIKPYLFGALDRIMDSVEGFQDITQCRQAAVLDQIAHNADYLIAAHWGDVWMDTMGLADKDANECDDSTIVNHALKRVKKQGREWLLRNISDAQLKGEDADQILDQTVADEMSELKQIKCPDFRMKAFKTDNWSFRWTTTSLRTFHPAAFPRLPFYDTRLADFFCTVPSKFFSQRQLQVDYLKRFAPELARITWQAHDANLFDYQKNSKLLPKRAAKKVWRLVTGKEPIERNWEVQFLNAKGRANLEAMLTTPGLRLHEFVSPQKIRGLLGEFYTDPNAEKRGYTVSMLLTLSAWLEKHG